MAKTLTPTDPYDWVRLIRRVRLGSTTKLIALLLADYASRDGGDVRPGIPRLANVAEVSERTVMRALATLREMGLIERTFEGSTAGKRGICDEYQLTIPDGLLESLPMLDPQESKVATPTLLAGNQVTSETEPGDIPDGNQVTPVSPHQPRGFPTGTPPSHNTYQDPTFRDHQAKVEGIGPIVVSEQERADLYSDDDEKRYRSASAILSRLPDLGAEFMTQAESQSPSEGYRQRLIYAAQLCVKGIPA